MEILKKTGKFLLGVVIGVAIMMFADRYYVKGKRLVADNLPKEPVEYVNPYMGNISHLLVPTYPTVHLPNSMLRVYPERGDFTGDRLGGLPLIVTSHRGSSAFNLSPYQGDEAGLKPVIQYSYDREKIVPYRYQVYLDEANIEVDYAPSHQSAVYSLKFEKDGPAYLVFNSRNGELKCDGNTVSGFQYVDKKTGKRYYQAAVKTLKSLASPSYLATQGTNGNFLLKHCVGSIPHKNEIDVPLVYADYYFLEALHRYKNSKGIK